MVNGIQGLSDAGYQTITQMQDRMFNRLDSDGDGQINLAELKANAEELGLSGDRFTNLLERLTAADTDGDGIVSREEFAQMAPPDKPSATSDMQDEMFNSLDSDGDGQIDLVELQAEAEETSQTDDGFTALLERLAEADADGDGQVSREEFGQMAPPPGPPPASKNGEDLFSLLDSDGDGQIDLTELQATAETEGLIDDGFAAFFENLSAADLNGDGKVSREEFAQIAPPEPPQSGKSDASGKLYSWDADEVESYVTGTLVDQLG